MTHEARMTDATAMGGRPTVRGSKRAEPLVGRVAA